MQGSRFTKLKRKDTSGVTRQFVSCDVCVKHQDVVKLYVRNGILPAIAQQQGTRFRRDTLTNHLAQAYHKQAISAERRKSLENTEKPTQTEVCISNANKELGAHDGQVSNHDIWRCQETHRVSIQLPSTSSYKRDGTAVFTG